jgi:hypothetical protein
MFARTEHPMAKAASEQTGWGIRRVSLLELQSKGRA